MVASVVAPVVKGGVNFCLIWCWQSVGSARQRRRAEEGEEKIKLHDSWTQRTARCEWCMGERIGKLPLSK